MSDEEAPIEAPKEEPKKEPRKPYVLTDKQQAFLRHYLKTGKAKQSAILAGYSPLSAPSAARDLLRKNPVIMKAVAEHMNATGGEEKYTLEVAMEELHEAHQLALKEGNANAATQAIKLKMQSHGLIEERAADAPFRVIISGIGDK